MGRVEGAFGLDAITQSCGVGAAAAVATGGTGKFC